MGDGTKIEWTDATWNPIIGCSRVSPGCDNCYAIGVVHREMSPQHVGLTVKPDGGRVDWTGEVRLVPHVLDKPLQWKRSRRIFVNSLSDLFHADLPDEDIAKVFAVMALAPQHQFQVLTKRSQRMRDLLGSEKFWDAVARFMAHHDEPRDHNYGDPSTPLPNVVLGVSVEDDKWAFRADHLRATRSAVRMISVEPLVGSVPSLDLTGIDWVVVGGESGPKARPMHPGWARGLREECTGPAPCPNDTDGDGDCWICAPPRRDPSILPHGRGPAFLFKQWGDWVPLDQVPPVTAENMAAVRLVEAHEADLDKLRDAVKSRASHNRVLYWTDDHWSVKPGPGLVMVRPKAGKHATGRELDGRTWDEYPA